MRFDKKIEINIFDFFKYGKFGYIKLDQTKEWVLNNFPDADSQYENKPFDILKYGNIEFHFHKNILFLIFCEEFDNFNGGKSLIIDKWILEKPNELKLLNVLEKLNENNIDYEKKEDSLGIKLKLESGVELTFENINDIENLNKNHYELTTFGLYNKEILEI
ncbi:MAG: hypothetical protein LBK94_06580 [Prevotellaceae bacterium]|jgi:hypothetical protein|nr:hypothetical protein [Prevotellaceae bacterium]